MQKYRWDSPNQWLMERAERWTEEEIRSALMSITGILDPDEVQDIFQDEMDHSGYFNVACSKCGGFDAELHTNGQCGQCHTPEEID